MYLQWSLRACSLHASSYITDTGTSWRRSYTLHVSSDYQQFLDHNTLDDCIKKITLVSRALLSHATSRDLEGYTDA